jgi:hypothetical protein
VVIITCSIGALHLRLLNRRQRLQPKLRMDAEVLKNQKKNQPKANKRKTENYQGGAVPWRMVYSVKLRMTAEGE